MPNDRIFIDASAFGGAQWTDYRGQRLPAAFAAGTAREYEAARREAALFDRSDRGLVIVRGKDRATWLHNLLTNAIKDLAPGAGCYAFALDVKGRIQFDLNVLNAGEELWLDIDRATIDASLAHFDRFLITEDVKIAHAGSEFARIGVSGPRAAELARPYGIADLPAIRPLSLVTGAAGQVTDSACSGRTSAFRHDFSGQTGFELIVPAAAAAQTWDALAAAGAAPAGLAALQALRIEAGIPWLGSEIDNTVLPAETGQVERAVNYHKGCYLGQEVVERMRSRGALARRLVRLRTAASGEVTLPAALRQGSSEVGRITSLAKHPIEAGCVGLGYLKSSVPAGTALAFGQPEATAEVLS